MNCSIHKTAVDFLGICRPALEAREAVFNLMLGISLRLIQNPLHYGSQPLFATVAHGGDVSLAALMTPPYKLQIAQLESESAAAVELLASELYGEGWNVPGVLSEEKTARSFASRWCELTGVAAREDMRQRIYQLTAVNPIPYATGELKQATFDDLDRAIQWGRSFHVDCFGDREHPDVTDEQTKAMIDGGTLFFWRDSEPVSMAALTRPTPHGISVGFVYTPPELRGKGYASAVVASLSQRCLDSGKEFCTLYTDLSNPTSNSIYQRIGYKPIADVIDIYFDESQAD